MSKASSRILVAFLCMLMAVSIVACSGGGNGDSSTPPDTNGSSEPDDSSGNTVVERSLAFEPASLEVSVGDIVTFTNEDSVPHEVSIDSQNLGVQNQGDSVTWTAEKTGTFPYTCTIHPSMTGEIVVK